MLATIMRLLNSSLKLCRLIIQQRQLFGLIYPYELYARSVLIILILILPILSPAPASACSLTRIWHQVSAEGVYWVHPDPCWLDSISTIAADANAGFIATGGAQSYPDYTVVTSYLYTISPGYFFPNTGDVYINVKIQSSRIIPIQEPTETFYADSALVGLDPGFAALTGQSPNLSAAKNNGAQSNQPGAVLCGEPITIGTGNLFESAKDYETAGLNQLSFIRFYNSMASKTTFAAALGSNWRSNFDLYLIITSGSSVAAERADGRILQFAFNGASWASDSDVDLQLTQTGSGTGSIWTLTDGNDTVETYTQVSPGKAILNTIVARNGYSQTLSYNANSQLVSVIDSFNRTLSFFYTGSLLTTLITPDGLVLTYEYNSAGGNPGVNDRLASVNYSTTPVTSQNYLYENNVFPFSLTGIVDQDGNRYTTWTYDAKGRALSSQLGSGADLTSFYYDDTTGNRTITNALGQQTLYTFANLQGVPKVITITRLASATVPAATRTFTYDSNGYMASQTDWNGGRTNYLNDVHGQPTSITEAAGTPQARTTTITYHAKFHLPVIFVGSGKTTGLTYDASGNLLTRTEMDTATQTVPYPTVGQTRTWTYTYDTLGHVLTASGPRTDLIDTTTYTYISGSDNLATVTDPLGHTSKVTTYTGRGLPLTMIDANGVVINFTYDILGRLLTRTVQASSGNATTNFAYDPAGNLVSITLPDSSQLNYQYDTAHRITGVTNNLGETIAYTLDPDGNVIQQSVKNTSATIVKTQARSFDSLSRMLQQIGASGQSYTFGYDSNGNRISIMDPLGNTTMHAFDALNRLISAIDPLMNTTLYSYDLQDNLNTLSDPRLLVTQYIYDGFGRVIQESSPDRGITVYTLDKAGNRVSEINARSVVTDRTFDALNRVTAETFPASGSENITYSYDNTSATNKGIGHLTGFTDESGRTLLTYDARGNVLTVSHIIGGRSYSNSYAYDLADHINEMIYPSGHIVDYIRDSLGRVIAVTFRPSAGANPRTLANSITYEPFGPQTGLKYGNGITRTQGYDEDYRLISITTNGVQNRTIIYDGADNITSITDHLVSNLSQNFTYDKDYQLLQAVGMYGTLSYTYDASGNRLTQAIHGTTRTYSYQLGSNLLSSITDGTTTRNLTYTPNGNITSDDRDHQHYLYGSRNRYKVLREQGITQATYGYNAIGERVIKIEATTTTHYHFDLKGHLIAETSRDGSVIREYVWLEDMPLAQIEANGSIYYVHPNQLNTPDRVTDSAGRIVRVLEQEPFGIAYVNTGTVPEKLRFPGQFFDAESGLNYNMNRDYDPTLGRYIEADPIGLAGGANLFAYARGNPLRFLDPLGTSFSNLLERNRYAEKIINASEDPNLLKTQSPSDAVQPYINKANAATSQLQLIGESRAVGVIEFPLSVEDQVFFFLRETTFKILEIFGVIKKEEPRTNNNIIGHRAKTSECCVQHINDSNSSISSEIGN